MRGCYANIDLKNKSLTHCLILNMKENNTRRVSDIRAA